MKRTFFATAACACALLLSGCSGVVEEVVADQIAPDTPRTAPAASVSSQDAPTFTSQAEKFSLWMPVAPQAMMSAEQAERKGLMQYSALSGKITYQVTIVKVPTLLVKGRSTSYLDGMQQGFLEASNGKLLSSRDYTVNGVAGREIVADCNDGQLLARSFFTMEPDMSYQVVAFATPADMQASKAEIDRVLNSFRLLK